MGTRVFVAGHRGLVGSAIVREVARHSQYELAVRARDALDLRDGAATQKAFEELRPKVVVLAAAKVGGIAANIRFPAEFIRENLLIQTSVIEACHRAQVERLVFLGSSCIYPRDAPQPLSEEALLSGPLESTNAPYAIAKIAGLKMVEAYRRQYGHDWLSLMPTNLYGPGDNFDLHDAHIVPALLRRFHEAKVRGDRVVTVWGTGTPRRELLHVEDLARAVLHFVESPTGGRVGTTNGPIVNVGTGEDLPVREDIAKLVSEVVGYDEAIEFDPSKPDGTPRKVLDVRRLHDFGFHARIGLRDGLTSTYAWFVDALERDAPIRGFTTAPAPG